MKFPRIALIATLAALSAHQTACAIVPVDGGGSYVDVVYATGTVYNGADTQAAYWIDDLSNPFYLTNAPVTVPGYRSSGNSIVVRNNTTYIAGISVSSDGHTTATVWRNGAVYAQYPGLPVGPNGEVGMPASVLPGNSYAGAMAFYGSDLYVTGGRYWQYSGSVWKSPLSNANAISTTAISGTAVPASIALVGSTPATVLVAGSDGGHAALWKNGVKYPLTSGDSSSAARHVYVNGLMAYVAGISCPQGAGCKAVYWTFNVTSNAVQEVSLTDASGWASAGDIAIYGGNTYVVGARENANGIYVAKMWINGVESDLTDGTHPAEAGAVFVTGSGVYVGGYLNASPIVWKDGQAYLYDPAAAGSIASIYVARQLVP